MSFSKLAAAKWVVSGVVGIGAGKIAKDIIKKNINPETLIDKVTTVAGAWALGGMVAKAAKKYTDEAIDDTVTMVTEQVADFKLRGKLARITSGEGSFLSEDLEPSDYIADDNGVWVRRDPEAKAVDLLKRRFVKTKYQNDASENKPE